MSDHTKRMAHFSKLFQFARPLPRPVRSQQGPAPAAMPYPSAQRAEARDAAPRPRPTSCRWIAGAVFPTPRLRLSGKRKRALPGRSRSLLSAMDRRRRRIGAVACAPLSRPGPMRGHRPRSVAPLARATSFVGSLPRRSAASTAGVANTASAAGTAGRASRVWGTPGAARSRLAEESVPAVPSEGGR